MSKFPHDPIIRGRYFKLNKHYSELRKKMREYKQDILNQIENLHADNPKAYCNLPGKLKDDKSSDGPRQANLVLIAYASSEGSGEPAHPRSLARTFATRSYKQ